MPSTSNFSWASAPSTCTPQEAIYAPRHGRVGLQGPLREALDTITAFLVNYPNEIVLVQAKRDMEDLLSGDCSLETPETRKTVEDCFASCACVDGIYC
jgi:hypothetical protein